MNLQKLIDMQRDLLNHIIKEKGLEQDLTKETFLSLLVELGEFANEGRWFKYWSENQKANIEEKIECQVCMGTGDENAEVNLESLMEEKGSVPYIACANCDETGITGNRNPLLEEYIDGIHFFLQVAILNKWEDALFIFEEQLDPDEFDGELTEWFLEMTYFINKSYFENPDEEYNQKWKKNFGFPAKQYWFRTAWILFLNIGINGFGFSYEEIEQAYMDKNQTNHERQANGY